VKRRELTDRREGVLSRTALQLVSEPTVAQVFQQQQEIAAQKVVRGIEATGTWQGNVFGEELIEIDLTFVEFELPCQTAGLLNGCGEFGHHRLWASRVFSVREFHSRQLTENSNALADYFGFD
jgi:hypothetical protein